MPPAGPLLGTHEAYSRCKAPTCRLSSLERHRVGRSRHHSRHGSVASESGRRAPTDPQNSVVLLLASPVALSGSSPESSLVWVRFEASYVIRGGRWLCAMMI